MRLLHQVNGTGVAILFHLGFNSGLFGETPGLRLFTYHLSFATSSLAFPWSLFLVAKLIL